MVSIIDITRMEDGGIFDPSLVWGFQDKCGFVFLLGTVLCVMIDFGV